MNSQPILKLSLGFECSDQGRLSLKIVSSRFCFLESFINKAAHFFISPALKLQEHSRICGHLIYDKSNDPYFTKLARAFNLTIKVEDDSVFLKAIPKTGSLIILMNHPANGRETISLASAVSKMRPDVKIVLTSLLQNYPGLIDNAIFLNLSPGEEAKNFNTIQRKKMDQWIKDGGVLLVHPAGEVSSFRHTTSTEYPVDARWRIGITKLIEENPDVQILPVFIDGMASATYHKINNIKSVSLRDTISPIFHIREIGSDKNKIYPANVGSIIKGQNLINQFGGNPHKMIRYLRAYTYSLKGRFEKMVTPRVKSPLKIESTAESKELIKQDILQMKTLTEESGLQVLFAPGEKIPHLLHEMRRLRQLNFRLVGAGSDHYLLLYDKAANLILGQSRIALFLPLIWQGLVKILEENHQYTHLLTPVNISHQFSDISKKIVVDFLSRKFLVKQNAEQKVGIMPKVTTNSRFQPQSPVLTEVTHLVPHIEDLKDLFRVVKDIDGLELPELIKNYSQLGARYLSFNYNPDTHCIDGMIVINLLESHRTELAQYFSEAGLRRYLQFHGVQLP